MKKWQERALAVGIFIICASAYTWARRVELPMLRAPDGHYTLADADSFTRWRLVERAMNGEDVRIRWINEDNAPYGRMNEWTSPMTIIGVGLVRVGEWLGGMSRARALEWGGLWVGPIVGLLSLAALGWLGFRTGGWSLSACWMVAWPVLEDVIQASRFGHTDHDNLHQLLFICIVGGCLACARRPSVVGGALIGLASAAAMWSAGSELLPALALVAVLAVYESGWMSPEIGRTGFWRAWWIVGLTGTTAAWLFEFWPHVLHGRLEFISIWHVGLWAIMGCLLECFVRWRFRERSRWMAIGGAVLAAILATGAARGFNWWHLHVMQEERFQRQMAVTSETQSFMKDGVDVALRKAWWKYGLLPLCALALTYRFARLGSRMRWLASVLVVFLILILFQVRWWWFFVPALVMTAGVGVRHCWPTRPWVAISVVLFATFPPWFLAVKISQNVASVSEDSVRGPYVEMFASRAASDCLGQEARNSIVLATWDQGAVLAALGKVRVIGSVGASSWSNLEGLHDTYELFTTRLPSRFFELARQRKVDFVLIPPKDRLERAVFLSFVALHGKPPTRQEAFGAYIWLLATSDELRRVSCPPLSRLAPDWKIVRMSGSQKAGKE